jgi:hypothetical protein
MRFILAPLLVLLGLAMMRYTVQITEFTGKIDFAERYLSGTFTAGTYTWWRLIGLAIVTVSVLWFVGLTSVLGDLFGAIFGGILPGQR